MHSTHKFRVCRAAKSQEWLVELIICALLNVITSQEPTTALSHSGRLSGSACAPLIKISD